VNNVNYFKSKKLLALILTAAILVLNSHVRFLDSSALGDLVRVVMVYLVGQSGIDLAGKLK